MAEGAPITAKKTGEVFASPLPRSYLNYAGRVILAIVENIHGLGAFALITLVVVFIKNRHSSHVIHPLIRSQIERIILTPDAEGRLEVHLHGDLGRILQLCEAAENERERAGRGSKSQRPGRGGPGRGLSVVAGARNHLCRTVMAWA